MTTTPAPRRLFAFTSSDRYSIHIEVSTYDDTDTYDPHAAAQQLREAADMLEEEGQ